MTREYAKSKLKKNFEQATKLYMCVYTFFLRDLITDETTCVSGMFDNAAEARHWRDSKVTNLIRLQVPFACYIGDSLDTCAGELIFDDDVDF